MEDKFISDASLFKNQDGSEIQDVELDQMLGVKPYMKHKRGKRGRITDIIKNSVMSVAIGDALGVPFEFKSRGECKKYSKDKMSGYMTYNMPPGTWSDDTSMTLATIDAINEVGYLDYDVMAEKFCKWIFGGENTATGMTFDYGNTTFQALNKYANTLKDAEKMGSVDVSSNGNGSLMRMLPISLYTYFLRDNWDAVNNIVSDSSSITHGHDISKCGCFIYTVFVHYLMDGYTKETAYHLLKEFDFSKYYSEEILNNYSRILKGDIESLEEDDIKSSGYIVDSLEASMWSLLTSNNYKDTLVKAVNLGSDTDTIGAITGSIAGIIYSSSEVPEEWRNTLLKHDELEEKAALFANNLKHMNDLSYQNRSVR